VSEPSLSVVIATRDRAPFVARCLDALAAQDATVDEIVVVDQSGDDGTRQACVAHRVRVRYIHDPGRGQSRGRNIGVAMASGDLVACLDDDCYAHPDWARAVREVMARHPAAAGAFGEMLGGGGAPEGAAGLEVSTIRFSAETVGSVLVSAPSMRALHDQWRPTGALIRQMRGYGRGTGAYLGKHIFSGDPYAVALLVRQLAADAKLSASGLRRRSLLRVLAGAARVVGLAHGLSRGPALARRRRGGAQ